MNKRLYLVFGTVMASFLGSFDILFFLGYFITGNFDSHVWHPALKVIIFIIVAALSLFTGVHSATRRDLHSIELPQGFQSISLIALGVWTIFTVLLVV